MEATNLLQLHLCLVLFHVEEGILLYIEFEKKL
jgi:hypothetical protein